MKTSDIADETILGLVMYVSEKEDRWCMSWEIEERLPSIPPKVIRAKCRNLIKRGKLHGCTCGCRGDFYLCGSKWDYSHFNLVTGEPR
jgi:hypothetical protein